MPPGGTPIRKYPAHPNRPVTIPALLGEAVLPGQAVLFGEAVLSAAARRRHLHS